MIRKQLMQSEFGISENFRWRGGDVSRIEGLSDTVFGFAITLLVVSLEVPKTFGELLGSLSNFGAFGLSFLLLMFVWSAHYQYYRRYGLQDGVTMVLNTLLLFVIVLYVYPLKFLFTLFSRQLLNQDIGTMIQPEQNAALFAVYGLGFTAIYLTFGLMYWHAYQKREELALNPVEVFSTLENLGDNLIMATIGLISLGIALIASPENGGLAGVAYPVLIVPARTIYGVVMGRRRRLLAERLNAQTQQIFPDAQAV